jgi:hypothetical protein
MRIGKICYDLVRAGGHFVGFVMDMSNHGPAVTKQSAGDFGANALAGAGHDCGSRIAHRALLP